MPKPNDDLPQSLGTQVSLIQRVRDSTDAASWAQFDRLYRPFVFKIALRNGLARDDAEEIVQEVFAKVAQAIVEFELDHQRGRFRGWLKTITIRKVIDRRRATDRSVPAFGLAGEPAVFDSLDAEWDREYRRHVLDHAMQEVRSRIESNTWACFEEHTLKRRPAEAIAAELGMNVNAVYQNASRTIKRIRAQCLDYEEEAGDP
ncbi:MAG TPA: sigma-70 family RNA polymerase sigma factor [Planctomycetaceae bacterium]|nr:sigma-70 family RNA polymerase sigma factor [Planctomycetaceae bacterium]